MADWIWIPFGVVSGVSQGMGVLDRGGYCRREMGSFGGKCGASHCNQWGRRCAFPKLLWGRLVIIIIVVMSVYAYYHGHCARFIEKWIPLYFVQVSLFLLDRLSLGPIFLQCFDTVGWVI